MHSVSLGPAAVPAAAPVPSSEDSERPSARVLAIRGIVVAIVVLAVALGATRFYRLTALDDYRTGYAVGTVFIDQRQSLNQCEGSMSDLYNVGAEEPAAGWNEFLAGCQDAMIGAEPVSWSQLRQRVPGYGSD